MVEAFNNDLILRIGDLIFAAALVPNVLFLAVYTAKAPWWTSRIGRMFVFVQTSLIIVSLVVLASLFFGPDYPFRGLVRLFGYSLHFLGQWAVFFTYLRERSDPEKKGDQKDALPLIEIKDV